MRLYKLTQPDGRISVATTRTETLDAVLQGAEAMLITTSENKQTVAHINDMLDCAYRNGIRAGKDEGDSDVKEIGPPA